MSHSLAAAQKDHHYGTVVNTQVNDQNIEADVFQVGKKCSRVTVVFFGALFLAGGIAAISAILIYKPISWCCDPSGGQWCCLNDGSACYPDERPSLQQCYNHIKTIQAITCSAGGVMLLLSMCCLADWVSHRFYGGTWSPLHICRNVYNQI